MALEGQITDFNTTLVFIYPMTSSYTNLGKANFNTTLVFIYQALAQPA